MRPVETVSQECNDMEKVGVGVTIQYEVTMTHDILRSRGQR